MSANRLPARAPRCRWRHSARQAGKAAISPGGTTDTGNKPDRSLYPFIAQVIVRISNTSVESPVRQCRFFRFISPYFDRRYGSQTSRWRRTGTRVATREW